MDNLIHRRVRAKHPHAYRPEGCEEAVIIAEGLAVYGTTRLSVRNVYTVKYDNGYLDFITTDLEAAGFELIEYNVIEY